MALIENPSAEANQHLDQIFSALGLSEKRYRKGKGYHGVIGGREAHIYLESVRVRTNPNVPRAYMGHKLSIYLACEAHTRLAITWQGSVRDWLDHGFGTVPLTSVATPTGWEDLSVKAVEAIWVRPLILEQQANFLALARRQGAHGMSGFSVHPKALRLDLFLPWEQISLKAVDNDLKHLLAIAEAVEALPAPKQALSETARERNQRLRIPGFPWAGLGVFVLFALLVTAMAAVLRLGSS